MLTRRHRLCLTGASTLALFFTDRLGVTRQLFAQIPDTLDPATVAKFAANADSAGDATSGKDHALAEERGLLRDLYEAVHPADSAGGTAQDDRLGYGAVASESQRGLLVHNAPSLTIEAKWNRPVRVKWINDLRASWRRFLPHLLIGSDAPLGQPTGGVSGRDSRPRFETTPGPYRPGTDRDARAWCGRRCRR